MDIDIIALLLYGIALVMLVHACRMLIRDARAGFSLSMGAEMLFSHLWLVAGFLIAAGLWRDGFINGWWLFPVVVVTYCLSLPVRRVIRRIYLGRDLPPPSDGSCREFIRKAEHSGD